LESELVPEMKGTRYLVLGLLLAAVVMALSSCATTQKKLVKRVYSDTEMEEYARKILSDDEYALFHVPYKINNQLRELASAVAQPGWSKSFQAKQLAIKLLTKDQLGIVYSHNYNLCAEEVFRERKANCISYTNLFIGMARSIGILAEYAEVTEIESYVKVGDTIVYNSHICAVVYEGPNYYLIDFSLRPYKQYHFWQALNDLEATAVFYNNMGAQEYLKTDDPDRTDKALTYYHLSRKLAPNLPQVYNNLGVLELNRNNISKAESYFHTALENRPGYFAAYSNLASIYMMRGELDKAISLYQSAIVASPENMYAYHALALLQIRKGDLESAERNLRKALSLDDHYTESRHELGRLLLRGGRLAEAFEQFAIALRLQPDDKVARSKMDLIQSLSMTR
jgi:Flp pilus assembly protein TadD